MLADGLNLAKQMTTQLFGAVAEAFEGKQASVEEDKARSEGTPTQAKSGSETTIGNMEA